jgi:hypothetical protein
LVMIEDYYKREIIEAPADDIEELEKMLAWT